MKIQQISIDILKPNPWNPNQMTKEEYAELLAEVKHLGRPPKPIVIRRNCDGFEIIDGEHSWRAAKECGQTEVPCETIEADDFEAMRQTYKRNQHGKHDPLLEGRSWKRMLQVKTAGKRRSVRQLAKVLSVSEGTIRNGLIYVQADEAVRKRYGRGCDDQVRNRYARQVHDLTVEQARSFVSVLEDNPGMAFLWFESGADTNSLKTTGARYSHIDSDLYEYLHANDRHDFERAFKKLRAWARLERKYDHIDKDTLREYTQHYYQGVWYVREKGMIEDCLDRITNAEDGTFYLPPEEFAACIEECNKESSSTLDFERRLELRLAERGLDAEQIGKDNRQVRLKLQERRMGGLPDCLRDAQLPYAVKILLGEIYNDPEQLNSMFETWNEDAVRKVIEHLAKHRTFPLPAWAETNKNELEGGVRHVVKHQLKSLARQQDAQREMEAWSGRKLAKKIAQQFWGAEDVSLASAMEKKLGNVLTKVELIALYQVVKRDDELNEYARIAREVVKAM